MIRVTAVHPDTIGDELGLVVGTELLAVDGRELHDFLDWEFLTAEEAFVLHVRQPDASVVVRLDLSGAPEALTILSGRESVVSRLDLLREAVGDEPADWYPALTGRAWPGTAASDEDGGFSAWEAAE